MGMTTPRARTAQAASRDGRPLTLAAEAYARLEEMIILGRLRPDTRLSEQSLAQELGIGRTPIREALQKLRENNLVEIIPRAGVFVTRMDVRSQLLVMEVRRELELLVASRAARRATPEQRQQFRKLAAGMRRSGEKRDKRRLMEIDLKFKDLSLAAANNVYLSAALAPIHAHSRRFFFSHQETTDPTIASTHADAMEAIAAGSEERAVATTAKFLDAMEAFTMAAIAKELTTQ